MHSFRLTPNAREKVFFFIFLEYFLEMNYLITAFLSCKLFSFRHAHTPRMYVHICSLVLIC